MKITKEEIAKLNRLGDGLEVFYLAGRTLDKNKTVIAVCDYVLNVVNLIKPYCSSEQYKRVVQFLNNPLALAPEVIQAANEAAFAAMDTAFSAVVAACGEDHAPLWAAHNAANAVTNAVSAAVACDSYTATVFAANAADRIGIGYDTLLVKLFNEQPA
ncbi:hypothetical protein [Aliidiomarina quisquiliarum]|uniref:hypothetical protein n=1 Tax=Aliidiomarina quisquiliarum TaxID=2938947 RepID=UPI00208EE0AB|nr:hypothetical protein [Aliidiomarina quisquiliarum]MCO4320007.1 hypothetical protein [Aliidiomarina quisquiliarum]